MSTLIELNNYCKTIKKVEILKNITLKMESGKVYGLKGKNGSGKTMMMRAICGLILPTSGEVKIDGTIIGKDISFPPSIGVLLENPSFLNEYTGFKNLKIIASIQDKIDDNQINKVLTLVGLDPCDKRTYRKYSLGMKQRLGIAAAIMEQPDIVILDEPINALDEAGAKQVREILKQQKERGAVCIIACHDSEELEFLSDEIIEIYEGKIMGQYRVEKGDVINN
ncbi:MAG: ABC transporter ATP-binding protein [Lachnospira sp.]|nr:ABC transporter ATP-binding protein [Lachnospira sp.]